MSKTSAVELRERGYGRYALGDTATGPVVLETAFDAGNQVAVADLNAVSDPLRRGLDYNPRADIDLYSTPYTGMTGNAMHGSYSPFASALADKTHDGAVSGSALSQEGSAFTSSGAVSATLATLTESLGNDVRVAVIDTAIKRNQTDDSAATTANPEIAVPETTIPGISTPTVPGTTTPTSPTIPTTPGTPTPTDPATPTTPGTPTPSDPGTPTIPVTPTTPTTPTPTTPSHSVSVFSVTSATPTMGEGNSGTTAFTFTVTRSGDTNAAETVNATIAGTGAHPINAADLGPGSTLGTTTLTFAPGETNKAFTVRVAGDTMVEPNETFRVTLTGTSTTSQVGTSFVDATVVNDDVAVSPLAITLGTSAFDIVAGSGQRLSTGIFTRYGGALAFNDATIVSDDPTASITLTFSTGLTDLAGNSVYSLTGNAATLTSQIRSLVWEDLTSTPGANEANAITVTATRGGLSATGTVTVHSTGELGTNAADVFALPYNVHSGAFSGGAGNDTLTFQPGTNYVQSIYSMENVTLSASDDTLNVAHFGISSNGASGRTVIDGGAGTDTIKTDGNLGSSSFGDLIEFRNVEHVVAGADRPTAEWLPGTLRWDPTTASEVALRGNTDDQRVNAYLGAGPLPTIDLGSGSGDTVEIGRDGASATSASLTMTGVEKLYIYIDNGTGYTGAHIILTNNVNGLTAFNNSQGYFLMAPENDTRIDQIDLAAGVNVIGSSDFSSGTTGLQGYFNGSAQGDDITIQGKITNVRLDAGAGDDTIRLDGDTMSTASYLPGGGTTGAAQVKIYGGSGADTFLVQQKGAMIADFNTAEGDKINLHGVLGGAAAEAAHVRGTGSAVEVDTGSGWHVAAYVSGASGAAVNTWLTNGNIIG